MKKHFSGLLLTVSALLFLPFTQVVAQQYTTAAFQPSVVPPSPDAAALMKFTDIPVSTYTGTADISVPIYTIKAKGLTVPIDIAYHTSGIKVREQASSVGLGWALNGGGCISRTIMGSDDFGTQPQAYFTTQVPQLAGDMAETQPPQMRTALSPTYFDFTCSYKANTFFGTEDFTNAFTGGASTYDMEPDIFSYNFPGHSGKFMITRSGQIVLQKQENIQIRYQGTGATVTFTITDDQGNNFYFNTTETSQTYGAPTPVSSWLISRIVTQQQDSIIFNYSSAPSLTVRGEIDQSYGAYCSLTGFSSTQAPSTIYNNVNLQSIKFDNGELKFFYDNVRSDMQAGSKLDSVEIFSMNAAGALTYLHSQDFYYGYFNYYYPTSQPWEFLRLRLDSVKEVSTTGSLPPYSFVYDSALNAGLTGKDSFYVDHWGYCNGGGQGNTNGFLIPTVNTMYGPPSQYCSQCVPGSFTFNGANRESSFEDLENFVLIQVNYPTGGKTVLTYAANDYDYGKSVAGPTDFPQMTLVQIDTIIQVSTHGTSSGPLDFTFVWPPSPPGSGITNLNINLAFIYLQNNDFTINQLNKVYFNFTGENINLHQDIVGTPCQSGTPACSISLPVSIQIDTSYTWSIYIDPSVSLDTTFSEVHVTFQYEVTQQDLQWMGGGGSSNIFTASGLRVQSITNYKDAVTPASEKTYTYGYTSGGHQYSYGRLMSIPSYIRYVSTFNQQQGTYCSGMYLFSSSNTPLTSVIQGNIVGYDQVTETEVDPLTGKDLGYTVYKYFNSPDSSYGYGGYRIPGTLDMGNSLNGLLLSKIQYANNGGIYQPVTETDNYFHTTNRTVYFSPKYEYVTGTPLGTCSPNGPVSIETAASFYPSLKSEKVLEDSTIETVYAQQNAALYAAVRTYYYYDNPLHYQVTRASSVDSKGDTLVTKIKYPQDYIPSGQHVTGNTILDTMIGRNMVSEPVEKQDSFYYPGSSSGYITGSQLNLFRISSGSPYNTIVPDRTYNLAINSPVTNFQPFAISDNTTSQDSRYRQMLSFDQYDSYNNLQQYTPVDQNSVTFVWDYNHINPIAQVKNSALVDVAATSFEADGTGGWTITGGGNNPGGITGNNTHSMNSSTISKSGLTSTNTYIVSYWTSNGNAYNIAGTVGNALQGKRISGWNYFEHKITGVTSVSITGSGNIDELRLYPATAQMTTYTYNPLVGTTTICDVDNKVIYYFYDAYQRLIRVKDQDGNIIKTYQYHYAKQNPYNQ
jgi:hypothetical protein